MDELVAAQQLLGRTLGKARAGEDKELSGRVRDAGEALAQMLGSALKMTRVHAADNKAFDVPVAETIKALKALHALIGPVHLVTVDEQAWVNDVHLRVEGKPSIRELAVELRKHNIGGITFHAPLEDRHVRALAAALAAPPQEPMPRTAVRTKLEAAGVKAVELHGVYRFRTSGEKGGSSRATGVERPRTAAPQPAGGRSAAAPAARRGPGVAGAGGSTAAPVGGAGGAGGFAAAPGGGAGAGGFAAAPAGGASGGAPVGGEGSGGGFAAAQVGASSGVIGAGDGVEPDPVGGVVGVGDGFEPDPVGGPGVAGVSDGFEPDPVGGPGAIDPADASFDAAPIAGALEGQRGVDAGAGLAAATTPELDLLCRLRALAAGAWSALATGRTFNPLPLRRAVAEVLELGPGSPALWDAWVTGPTRGDHAVAVTLHALLVGQAAGLTPSVLQDLGVAALVHDIGYAGLLGTPQASGAAGLDRHPGEGARLLLQQKGFSQAKVRRLRAVLDHHRPWGSDERPSLLGAVLHLVDDYLGFVRIAGDRTTAVHVLGAMAQDQGALYHPALLQLFVNALGQFPPGVLMGLADGRTVCSVSPVRGPETFAAPLVRVVDPQTRAAVGPLQPLSANVTGIYPGQVTAGA